MPLAAYVVPCSSAFRGRVEDLARRSGLTPSDLALAFLTVIPADQLDQQTDPGEPKSHDRDAIALKSGPRAGQILKRKPRLQLRLPPRLTGARIRKALGLALRIDGGTVQIQAQKKTPQPSPAMLAEVEQKLRRYREERESIDNHLDHLRCSMAKMAFEVLPQGINSVADARYVMGFPPSQRLSPELVKSRFRMLSQIYHPDRPTGDNERMGQLIEASRFLDSKLAIGLA